MLNPTIIALIAVLVSPLGQGQTPGAWKNDPAWYGGKAEWALYDATRPIYGKTRQYEATIFTNKQRMDQRTLTKASGDAIRSVEVFKHNLSEMIPTEHYTYRFLTTCFLHTDNLEPFKLAVSTQEDCGTTYKQFTNDQYQVTGVEFSYFPDEGTREVRYKTTDTLAFHDDLSLRLRDYPFDAETKPKITLDLVPDQTHTHTTRARTVDATVKYAGRETIRVPYGSIDTHHLRVTHPTDGGTSTTDYWFAADADKRHVMVKYAGPYGITYELKRLEWWAYWAEPKPAAAQDAD